MRLMRLFTAFAVLLSCIPLSVSATPEYDGAVSDYNVPRYTLEQSRAAAAKNSGVKFSPPPSYNDYYETYDREPKPVTSVDIDARSVYSAAPDGELSVMPELDFGTYEGVSDVLIWRNDLGEVTYSFDVAEAGMYNLEINYFPITSKNTTTEIGVMLDGKFPFATASRILLDKYWCDGKGFTLDSRDNQMLPEQVEYETWITAPLKDREGVFDQPYLFMLTKGRHYVTFVGEKVCAAFKRFSFVNYPVAPVYTTPSEEELRKTPPLPHNEETYALTGSDNIFIQAETPLYKSEESLLSTSDRLSAATVPSHPTGLRYNTLGGGGKWRRSTQLATWDFKIPADGYYKIAFRVRQNQMRGTLSARRVTVDGEVPFREMETQLFPYNNNWYTALLSGKDGAPLYLYLTAGSHTICMEAVPGTDSELIRECSALIEEADSYYRKIIMAMGSRPDENNSGYDALNAYYLDRQIPDLLPAFERISARLFEFKDEISKGSSEESVIRPYGIDKSVPLNTRGVGENAASVQSLAIQLQRCVARPDSIPAMRRSIKDSISEASAWLLDYREQPLELDYIEIATPYAPLRPTNVSGIKQLSFNFNAFVGSFFVDYTKITDTTDAELQVWVSLDRDRAVMMKELTTSDFNVNHGRTKASVNVVQGSLTKAVLAGNTPDIALFAEDDLPVQFAARGLTVDLSLFKDYGEVVKERYEGDVTNLFNYNGGVYGLPITQDFPMMFYRTDVLGELGLSPPETWADLVDIIPSLQRAYLSVGLVSPTDGNGGKTGISGSGNYIDPVTGGIVSNSNVTPVGDTFALLQLQNAGCFYSDDMTKAEFDTETGIAAFTAWTKFYNVYNFEQSYDVFARFRTGNMPIVIQPYTFYNRIATSAPELSGLWDFCPVPGSPIAGESSAHDGEDSAHVSGVSHMANGSATAAIIFESAKNKAAAWNYVKWFTSAPVQVRFGRDTEALRDDIERYNTANKVALSRMSWSTSDYIKISEQMRQLHHIPIIPATYATTKYLRNAFRAVVYSHQNPRESLLNYTRDINTEIARKNAQLAGRK